jgi:nicotinamide-nucleotide amidase
VARQDDDMNAPPDLNDRAFELAEQLAQAAQTHGLSLAAAESLTGGKITSHLSAAPKSSTWLRGGVVAYAKDVKFRVLGVADGPVVTPDCAQAMAVGVADLLGADAAVSVTGVGGPEPEEGHPVGTVWFGVTVNGRVHVECQHFEGDPARVVEATTEHAMRLLLQRIGQARAA